MCTKEDEKILTIYNNEGLSISSMARITGISKSNVVNKIRKLGQKIIKPNVAEEQKEYEVDEMTAIIGRRQEPHYIIYAINRKTKCVMDFIIGRRTKENIKVVTSRIMTLNPKKVLTDGLNIYPGLIPEPVHKVSNHGINRIERNNLTLRMQLKRLGRKTICFSRSTEMLESSLKIYFWGCKNHYSPSSVL